MSEAITIARPYAEAIFRLARQSQHLPLWSDTLNLLAQIVGNEQVAARISDPGFDNQQILQLFLTIAAQQLDQQARNLLQLLIENRRLRLLPEIYELYQQLRAQHEEILDAKITSAFPITEQQTRELIQQLEAKFKRQVESKVVVDPELIGGVKIEIGDQVLDASIRAKLQALTSALIH